MFVYTIQKPVADLQPGDVIIAAGNRALTLERPTGVMLGYQSWEYTRYEGNGNGPTGAVGADIQIRVGSKVTVLCVDISADEPAEPTYGTEYTRQTALMTKCTPEVIAAMRAWVADCEWADDTTHLSDRAIVNGVDRHFAGGVDAFLIDGM